MTLCALTLVTSEFLPVSLLTPMAQDLGITEGQVGQTISISGLAAVVAGLTWPKFMLGTDRRMVLLAMAGLAVVSGLIAATAQGMAMMMAGRLVLGVTVGVFWSLMTPVCLRILPPSALAGGLAVVNAGVALSGTIAAPLGSLMGELIGWRLTFSAVVGLAGPSMAWLWLALPRLPAERDATGRLSEALRVPLLRWGQISLGLFFTGQFLFQTYLRPFLEQVTHTDGRLLPVLFLLMGLGGVAGNVLLRASARIGVRRLLICLPALMAVLLMGMAAAGEAWIVTAGLLAAWGFLATPCPAIWGATLARARQDMAERIGGVTVAVIQLAIMSGSFLGGAILDHFGALALVALAALVLILSAATSRISLRHMQPE